MFQGTGTCNFFLKSAELSVSVFEICAFLKNIAELLGGIFSINKMNVQLEITV